MTHVYYYISFLSGVVEIGSLYWGLSQGYALPYVIGLVFAYQLGNIACYYVPDKLNRNTKMAFAAAILLGIASYFFRYNIAVQYTLELLTLFIGSTFLQLERDAFKASVSDWKKWKKRACRVAGFFGASVMASNLSLIILLLILFSLLIISIYKPEFRYDLDLTKSGICWPMITHQAHYFVYCYVLCSIMFDAFSGAIITSACLVLNWIPYTITEPLVKSLKVERHYNSIAVLSHLANAIIMAMVFSFIVKDNLIAAVASWMLTGFGGGNVFCIRKGLKKYIEYDSNSWMFSEQLGHILGMIVCMILVLLEQSQMSFFASSVFALITIPVYFATMAVHKGNQSR